MCYFNYLLQCSCNQLSNKTATMLGVLFKDRYVEKVIVCPNSVDFQPWSPQLGCPICRPKLWVTWYLVLSLKVCQGCFQETFKGSKKKLHKTQTIKHWRKVSRIWEKYKLSFETWSAPSVTIMTQRPISSPLMSRMAQTPHLSAYWSNKWRR